MSPKEIERLDIKDRRLVRKHTTIFTVSLLLSTAALILVIGVMMGLFSEAVNFCSMFIGLAGLLGMYSWMYTTDRYNLEQ